MKENEEKHESIILETSCGGVIIAIAKVSDCKILTPVDSPAALIDCKNVKRYGLFLTDIIRVEPYPFHGGQCQKYVDINKLTQLKQV
jgi:hypothetical protein